jgi:hypothetical protein
LNRFSYAANECTYQDFDFRVIEILALCSIEQGEVLFDKLESLRRYLFRHEACLNSTYCRNTFERLRAYILHNQVSNFTSHPNDETEVYGLGSYINKLASHIFEKRWYNSKSLELARAAES